MKYRLAIALACCVLAALVGFFLMRDGTHRTGRHDPTTRSQVVTADDAQRTGANGATHHIEVNILPPSDAQWTIQVLSEDGSEIDTLQGAGNAKLSPRGIPTDWHRMVIRAAGHLGEIVPRESLYRPDDIPLDLKAWGAVRVHITHRGKPVAGVPVNLQYLMGLPSLDNVPPDQRRSIRRFARPRFRESDSIGIVFVDQLPPIGKFYIRITPGTGLFTQGTRPSEMNSYTPRPGQTIDVRVSLGAGIGIRGTLVDHRGVPRPHTEVSVRRAKKAGHAKRAAYRFSKGTRARTNSRGAFFVATPKPRPTEIAWIEAAGQSGGVAQVVRARVPDTDTDDVVDIGIVRPLDTMVTFVCRGLNEPANAVMTVRASGETNIERRSLGTDFAPIDAQGNCSIAGLPIGRLYVSVYETATSRGRRKRKTRRRMTEFVQFSSSGQRITLDVPAPTHETSDDVTRGPSPIVKWTHPQHKKATLILMPHDPVGWLLDARPGQPLRLPKKIAIGRYTLFARTGPLIARHEIIVREDACTPSRIDTWTLRMGRRFRVRVLREGKPMAQASIKIRDFGLENPRPYGDQQRFVIGLGGSRMNVLWGLTDETGILELTGLPLDCKRIAGYASEGGQGRSFRVTFADAKQPYDIDLGP